MCSCFTPNCLPDFGGVSGGVEKEGYSTLNFLGRVQGPVSRKKKVFLEVERNFVCYSILINDTIQAYAINDYVPS